MKSIINPLKAKLAAGSPVLGIWSIISCPTISEIISWSGFDFVILDAEHGTHDLISIEGSIRAGERERTTVIVRPPGLDGYFIQKCLDVGAHGLLVPQVRGNVEAAQAVAMTKFAPSGTRGLNPFTRAGYYGAKPLSDCEMLQNSFPLTGIIVENRSCYEELDQILENTELDLIYLGVYDMSVALGCPGEVDHPSVQDFLMSALPRIRRAGKSAGLMVKSEAELNRYLDLGANFIVYGLDSALVARTMGEVVKSFRRVSKTR